MQTGYQCCDTLTFAIWHCVEQRQRDSGAELFYKFNCAPMSTNLRQPDAIWEPDCPVRRAEERDLPNRNKHTVSLLILGGDELHDNIPIGAGTSSITCSDGDRFLKATWVVL